MEEEHQGDDNAANFDSQSKGNDDVSAISRDISYKMKDSSIYT